MNGIVTIEQEKISTVALVDEARQFTILDFADRDWAESYVSKLAHASKKWDELTGPNKKAAYESYQSALRLHDDLIAELDGARKSLKQKCIAFDDEQERIRREEERRLQEVARKQAEEEALAAALSAEAEGEEEIAEIIISAPVVAPIVTVQRQSPAPTRLTAGRSVWSAEVVDLGALVKAASANPSLLAFLLPNLPALNKMATAMKSSMNVPGVKAVERRV